MEEDPLILPAQLEGVAKVPPWTKKLALKYSIPETVQFAIDLCLEEILSNIILHGCGGGTNTTVAVRFEAPQKDFLVFLVEDEAPYFNPLDYPELSALNPHERMRVGGQGIRLLRRFADTLEYERMPHGNRLKIGFSVKQSTDSSEM